MCVNSLFTVLAVESTPRSRESLSDVGQPMHLFILQFGFVLVREHTELCTLCIVIRSKLSFRKPFWVVFYLICFFFLMLG